MMYSTLLVAATAAFASAQATYDDKTGKFICPADKPNGAFCAGDSLGTNIIIRCTNGVGQPGNCNDNLAGYFPFGVRSSQCWQSSPTSGIAACAKNCIVQGGSGTYNGTFTLPYCTPIPQSSTTSPGYPTEPTTTITYINSVPPTYTPEPTTTKTYINPGPPTYTPGLNTTQTHINPGPPTYTPQPTTTKTYVNPGPTLNGTITITSTGTTTTTCVTSGTTTTSTITFTTTYCPPTSSSTLSTIKSTYVQPSGTGSPTGNPIPVGNGTYPTTTLHGSATATPVGPSASSTSGPVLANSAIVNSGSTGATLAAVGLLIAYFL